MGLRDQGEKFAYSADCALWTCKTVLAQALKLLHPFMPFVTEEIYCTLLPEEESIMIASWPEYKEELNAPEAEELIEITKEVVRGVRNIRNEMNVPMSRKSKVYIVADTEAAYNKFMTIVESFGRVGGLMGASSVEIQMDKAGIGEDAVSVVTSAANVYIPLEDLVDMEKEKERLTKEAERLDKEIARCQGMLNNERFTSKAPAAKVQEEREKLASYTKMKEQVMENLAKLLSK